MKVKILYLRIVKNMLYQKIIFKVMFGKINMDIYNKIVENLNLDIKPKKLILRYDLQDLFNYHIYYKNNINKYNLLGKNLKKNIIYGLSVWENPQLNERNWGDVEGVKNLYKEKGVVKTNYHPNHEVHIISITFYTLQKVKDSKEFKDIFSYLS